MQRNSGAKRSVFMISLGAKTAPLILHLKIWNCVAMIYECHI